MPRLRPGASKCSALSHDSIVTDTSLFWLFCEMRRNRLLKAVLSSAFKERELQGLSCQVGLDMSECFMCARVIHSRGQERLLFLPQNQGHTLGKSQSGWISARLPAVSLKSFLAFHRNIVPSCQRAPRKPS